MSRFVEALSAPSGSIPCATLFRVKPRLLLLLALCAPFTSAAEIPQIRAEAPEPAPNWAVLERHLIEQLNRAGEVFADTYTLPDGSLRWMERYEGGMNSSDDAYEAFRGYSLLYALGGDKKLDELHRHIWDGITKQFTRYGQIYREFDSNWDWMHHGEGYTSFYPFGMVEPHDELFRDRSERFAQMYTGEDPEAQNYDKKLKIIRASMNGSRGPKMEWVKRDWIPTNANLVYYHLPVENIPGVNSTTGWINDHPDNDQFAKIVKAMSDHMARGDVPINMTATPLVANAFLYTGDDKYKDWVKEYVGAWVERTKENGGITPDNVGLSGKIGEYNDGNWWGGYYGWKWVRGGTDIVLAAFTGAKVATLLTGDRDWFELPRSQLRLMSEKGRQDGKRWLMPIRYGDQGWHYFVPQSGTIAAEMWSVTQDSRDWEMVDKIYKISGGKSGSMGWAAYLKGDNPNFPEEAFRGDLKFAAAKLYQILNEAGDPETWYDAKWLALDPVATDNLVRLTVGGPPIHKRGEMLHSFVRYFDGDELEPGLPQGVSALVSSVADDAVEIQLVNTNLFEERTVIVQGGAYGEHRITEARWRTATDSQPPGARVSRNLETEVRRVVVDGKALALVLAPGAGTTLDLSLERWALTPSYEFPWEAE